MHKWHVFFPLVHFPRFFLNPCITRALLNKNNSEMYTYTHNPIGLYFFFCSSNFLPSDKCALIRHARYSKCKWTREMRKNFYSNRNKNIKNIFLSKISRHIHSKYGNLLFLQVLIKISFMRYTFFFFLKLPASSCSLLRQTLTQSMKCLRIWREAWERILEKDEKLIELLFNFKGTKVNQFYSFVLQLVTSLKTYKILFFKSIFNSS